MKEKLIKYIIIISIIIVPHYSHAETHVYNSDERIQWTWSKENSPYILEENIYIPRDHRLYIDEGVKVIPAENNGGDSNTITLNGNLTIRGTKENPVLISNLNTIYLEHSNVDITYAEFSKTGLSLIKSTTTIANSTFRDAFKALAISGSNVDIKNSKLLHNSYGISAQTYIFGDKTGGIGNAELATFMPLPYEEISNTIAIHDSVISGNTIFGIDNQDIHFVDAQNVWWGNTSGPNLNDTDTTGERGDKITGKVNFEPWKISDPDSQKTCCSNVLFIPGLEASRLYKDTKTQFGTTTNTLWEPNRNDDVRKLYMDEKGQSIDKTIYTKDIVGRALGAKDIYTTFVLSMNALVLKKSINEWLPLPYDWRKNVEDLVTDEVLNKVYDLASTSQTKKITIIAHSNGGLFTKVLMKKLEELHKESLVNKVIFVAVPELGTPQALLAMLHGHNQAIVKGAILSENNARSLAQNIPGSYGLLPSKAFFENSPFKIVFDLFSGNSEKIVASFESMKKFVLENSFSKKSSTDLNTPLILNKNLFALADSLHSKIDSWKFPTTTKSLSIMGWGITTPEAITYEKDKHCNQVLDRKCSVIFSPEFTDRGDGTVVVQSNSNKTESKTFFNLKKVSKGLSIDIDHADILKSGYLLLKLEDIITEKETNNSIYQNYFSEIEPISTEKYLTIKLYSPVDIHIYDAEGNHTGIIENPDPEKDFDSFETKIPDSFYGEFGDVKVIRVPYDSRDQIILNGNDEDSTTASFITDIEISQGDRIIASTTFSDMPVMPNTNIDLVIASSTELLASSSIMYIDMDGDGAVDITNQPNTNKEDSRLYYIEALRKYILSLKLSALVEKRLLAKIDTLESKSVKRVEKVYKKLINKRFTHRKLTDTQKTKILKLIDIFLAN